MPSEERPPVGPVIEKILSGAGFSEIFNAAAAGHEEEVAAAITKARETGEPQTVEFADGVTMTVDFNDELEPEDDGDGWCLECGEPFHLDDVGGYRPPCRGCGNCRSCCECHRDDDDFGPDDDLDDEEREALARPSAEPVRAPAPAGEEASDA